MILLKGKRLQTEILPQYLCLKIAPIALANVYFLERLVARGNLRKH